MVALRDIGFSWMIQQSVNNKLHIYPKKAIIQRQFGRNILPMPSLPRVPLSTLPTFRAAAKAPNLRAAAEQLHLTHSAVSQQLKLLQTQLGFELFDRRGKRLVLNPAGAALLRATEAALDRLAEGVRDAEAAASGATQSLRLTSLPSFAQRWLLPRIGRWRERHPDIVIQIDTSRELVDLRREGCHVALRQGDGQWRGLHAEQLTRSPLIVVATPARAARLQGVAGAALAGEPLLGDAGLWQRWFALSGHTRKVRPVAEFADAGLMLQATEQDLGIALVSEVLAADALVDGRLVRLGGASLPDADAYVYWWVCPPELIEWPALKALHDWVFEEIAASRRALRDKG
jgi:LysR family glycine cleavage system transcriptional activator